MTVTDLKKLLDQLPPQCANFRVDFTAKVDFSPGNISREDHPISGSTIDWQTQEVLLMTNETFSKLKEYVK